jgi:uncharacterized protein (TIGR02466 family)
MLTEDEKQFFREQPYVRMESNNGSYTQDKRILENEKLSRLKNEILENIKYYLVDIYKIDLSTIEFYITTSWCNKHVKNDFSHRHNHKNSIFSGVFYFDIAPYIGGLFIEYHTQLLPSPVIEFKHTESNIFNSRVWQVYPKENLVAIFPSTLMHYVGTNTTDTERYSVPFNIFVKGKLGWDEMELNL